MKGISHIVKLSETNVKDVSHGSLKHSKEQLKGRMVYI